MHLNWDSNRTAFPKILNKSETILMSFMIWKWCRMKKLMVSVNNIKVFWNLVYIMKMLIMSSYALLTLFCWWSVCFCENLWQPQWKRHRKFSGLSWEGILIWCNLFYHPTFEKLRSVDGAACYHHMCWNEHQLRVASLRLYDGEPLVTPE